MSKNINVKYVASLKGFEKGHFSNGRTSEVINAVLKDHAVDYGKAYECGKNRTSSRQMEQAREMSPLMAARLGGHSI